MDYIKKFKIKQSDLKEMKLVFTAQSKNYFYCRDVVCEYVIKQGYLPINPFRVFDYFLGDRVERDLIRRGNNQLIRTCSELWVFGNIADGVLFEIFFAIEQKKIIRFFTIGSEIKEIKEVSVDDITFEPQVHAAQIKKQDIIDFIKTGNVKMRDDLSGQINIFEEPKEISCVHSMKDENMMTPCMYDVAVVGLGPAGMMALNYLFDTRLHVIGIEAGKNPVQRELKSEDVATGFGGAGLFSDGKLSFYPSGSKLWSNISLSSLREAYLFVRDVLQVLGCQIPVWDNAWKKKYKSDDIFKIYESIYLNREQANQLIQGIYKKCIDDIILEAEVTRIKKADNGYVIETSGNQTKLIYAKNIIIATGKLGNSLIENIEGNISYKIRVEGGVRVETDSENFIPRDHPQVDYRIIEELTDGNEIRTFCCCKDGVVVASNYDILKDVVGHRWRNSVVSYNGTISKDKSGRSNIGITIRTENPSSIFAREFKSALDLHEPQILSMGEIDEISERGEYIIGKESDRIIKGFLQRIIRSWNEKYNIKFYWPEIEYYGKYPLFNRKNLRIPGSNIWVAGDVTAEFRGLIPSMVSGVVAASNVERIEKRRSVKNG